jgi:hypothetical protein
MTAGVLSCVIFKSEMFTKSPPFPVRDRYLLKSLLATENLAVGSSGARGGRFTPGLGGGGGNKAMGPEVMKRPNFPHKQTNQEHLGVGF